MLHLMDKSVAVNGEIYQKCLKADITALAAERIYLRLIPEGGRVDTEEFCEKLKQARLMRYRISPQDLPCEFIDENLCYSKGAYEAAKKKIFDDNVALIFDTLPQTDERAKKFVDGLWELFSRLGDNFSGRRGTADTCAYKKGAFSCTNVGVRQLLCNILSGSCRSGDDVTVILRKFCGIIPPAVEEREYLRRLVERRGDSYYLINDDFRHPDYTAAVFETFAFRQPENRCELLSRLSEAALRKTALCS